MYRRGTHATCHLTVLYHGTGSHTDAMISTITQGNNVAFVGSDPEHAPDGYYLACADGPAYELDADTTLSELRDETGQPTLPPKGSRVVDAIYYNKADGTTDW